MNYLAHGYRFLHDPLFVAGTAVPDWLSVVNRKVRARQRLVTPVVQSTSNEDIRRIGQGILQHHRDDDVFHRCEKFMMLEARVSTEFRGLMPDRFDHRPSFLGHIVVELMLDAAIVNNNTDILDRYYASLELVDANLIEASVNLMVTRKTHRLAWLIERFRKEKFLYDYLNDERMLMRLNQVLSRVKLPQMDQNCLKVLPFARELLDVHACELLETVADSPQ